MTDDGSGAGLRIPSMLVSKEDGDKLIDFMEVCKAKILKTNWYSNSMYHCS